MDATLEYYERHLIYMYNGVCQYNERTTQRKSNPNLKEDSIQMDEA